MARFFISYSRSVKTDVEGIVSLLRASGHQVWWDSDIPVIADWWETILSKIEWCEIFVFVINEKSLESPYCLAELRYANNRNRPILPFILEEVDTGTFPPELPHRNQWLQYDGNPTTMLGKINEALPAIQWEVRQDIPAPRLPEPSKGQGSLVKQFQHAMRLAHTTDYDNARIQFQNIMNLDFPEYGEDILRWLAILNHYPRIAEWCADDLSRPQCQREWAEYVKLYGSDFDPANIAERLGAVTQTSSKSERKIEAAMPICTEAGIAIKLKVKVSLPESAGLKAELPEVLPSGYRIQSRDVVNTTTQIEFPEDHASGHILPATVCLKIESSHFVVSPIGPVENCAPDYYELEIPADGDSRTLNFELTPASQNEFTGIETIYIYVYQEGKLIANLDVETEIVASNDVLPICQDWRIRRIEIDHNVQSTEIIGNVGYTLQQQGNQTQAPPMTVTRANQTANKSANPEISAAIIGAVAVIIAAIIGGGFGVYQVLLPRWIDAEETRTAGETMTSVVELQSTATTESAATQQSISQTQTSTVFITLTPTPSPTTARSELDVEIARAWNFDGENNEDWRTYIHPFDGHEMALVPVGCFLMGSTTPEIQAASTEELKGDINNLFDEQDQHDQCIEQPFWIDVTEITNRKYGSINAGSCDGDTDDELPVTCVTWVEALNYCEMRGGSLPTEEQWEYAARGVESWIFPWGDDFVPENTIHEDTPTYGFVRPAPAGSLDDIESWVGTFDMSGNVYEWTSTIYSGYQYPYVEYDGRENLEDPNADRVLRGGSYRTFATYVRGAERYRGNPYSREDSYGFRCVLPVETLDSAIERAGTFDGSLNSDWRPYIHTFENGHDMALVPVGCFERLDNDVTSQECIDEPFWIDVTEITNAESNITNAGCDDYSSSDAQPVNCILWKDATNYCMSRNGNLPTELQWEFASSGVESWDYPWGGNWNPNFANWGSSGIGVTADVGSFSEDESWVGAVDMAGNLQEWTRTLYGRYTTGFDRASLPDDIYPYNYQLEEEWASVNNNYVFVVRGGSFLSRSRNDLASTRRFRGSPGIDDIIIGFRCVLPVDAAQ